MADGIWRRSLLLNGMREKILNKVTLVIIEKLTEEIKQEIRERLSEICHGKFNINNMLKTQSYKATVKEFIRIYKKGVANRNKGIIGELLFHIVFGLNTNYMPCSLFFNLEERSFKKGYDSVYYSSIEKKLWIAEVKSGEMPKAQDEQKTSSQIIINLINRAKNDLEKRFQEENNSLWRNAMNHAIIALDQNNDGKRAVMSLLGQYSNDAEEEKYISQDKNVILVGVLFHPIEDEIDCNKVEAKYKDIMDEKIFNSLIVFAVQKSTYDAVYRFLEGEAADE